MSLVSQEAKVKTVGGEGKEHIKETPPSPPSKKQQHPKEKEKRKEVEPEPKLNSFCIRIGRVPLLRYRSWRAVHGAKEKRKLR